MLIVSIILQAIKCPNCGAPLPGSTCLYCGTVFQNFKEAIPAVPSDQSPKGLFEISLRDRSYCVLGLLAQGEHSQVLLAHRAGAVAEQVVIKVDGPDLESEWESLRRLQGRREYLDRLLPQAVAFGQCRGRNCLAYRWRSGFVHTLALARLEYPQGIAPEAAVWIWDRILAQLICLKDLGYSHGDLRLEHLLVHPRDHGIAFCGWGKARLGGQGDIAASARCIGRLLGSRAPSALRDLTQKADRFQDPRHLKEEVQKVARALFGPPRFQAFTLPKKTEANYGIR